MLNDQRVLVTTTTSSSNNLLHHLHNQDDDYNHDHNNDQDRSPAIRDIHALTPQPEPLEPAAHDRTTRSPSLSSASTGENFSSMSREFNALVLAGSAIGGTQERAAGPGNGLDGIHEEEDPNPLAIVLDNNPSVGLTRVAGGGGGGGGGEVSVQRVKKEEVETKINAWQNSKIAKINNRFKREDAVINGWEGEQVQKANSWMKKVERKLEEKRAKGLEKMQNDIAKAHRKAEERRASAEAKRGTKVARILEVANLMRAVGRAPVKRSFF